MLLAGQLWMFHFRKSSPPVLVPNDGATAEAVAKKATVEAIGLPFGYGLAIHCLQWSGETDSALDSVDACQASE